MSDERKIDPILIKLVKRTTRKIIESIEADLESLDNGSLFEKEMVINRLFALKVHCKNHMDIARQYIRTGLNIHLNEKKSPCPVARSYLDTEGHHDLYELSSCNINFENGNSPEIREISIPKHKQEAFKKFMAEMGVDL